MLDAENLELSLPEILKTVKFSTGKECKKRTIKNTIASIYFRELWIRSN